MLRHQPRLFFFVSQRLAILPLHYPPLCSSRFAYVFDSHFYVCFCFFVSFFFWLWTWGPTPSASVVLRNALAFPLLPLFDTPIWVVRLLLVFRSP